MARNTTTPPRDSAVRADLAKSVTLTRRIHRGLADVSGVSERRRALWFSLNRRGVTYEELAEANAISKQVIFRELAKVRKPDEN